MATGTLTRAYSLLMRLRAGEAVLQALDSIRVAKVRSALTILGVVIGVATVMAMASIVKGLRDQIVSTIEIAGPSTFYVMKVMSDQPLNPDDLPKWVRVRPDLTVVEADMIASLPEVHYAAIWGQAWGRIEYGGVRTQQTGIVGADNGYPEIYGGELVDGRWFTRHELAAGGDVVVLDERFAARVFGQIAPVDKEVKVAGRPARVVGLYRAAHNIFQPPGQETGAIVPYRMLDRYYVIDKTNALFIPVKPRRGITASAAQDAVTIALRERRRLRPAEGNTFDLITQDQILSTFNKITGVFVLVIMVLSGVGLLVGGIGVMAVMMISVTERTREIGVRKALGATRRDIMLQFLIEAATLTGIGGLMGVAVGLALGKAATTALGAHANPPLDLTMIAVAVSVGIGIAFGLLPARRAARLDPIEALRHE